MTGAPSRGRAREIHRAVQKRKDVLELAGFWRPIKGIIGEMPEGIFKRRSL